MALFLTLNQAFALAPTVITPGEYSVVLTWNANLDPGVAGYRVHYGTTSRNYSQSFAVGKVNSYLFSRLAGGVMHYFAISTYDVGGTESALSGEISVFQARPSVTTRLTSGRQAILTVKGLVGHSYEVQATQDMRTWTALGVATVGTNGSLEFTDTNAANYSRRFYRTREVLLP